jgi:hypothetical protein
MLKLKRPYLKQERDHSTLAYCVFVYIFPGLNHQNYFYISQMYFGFCLFNFKTLAYKNSMKTFVGDLTQGWIYALLACSVWLLIGKQKKITLDQRSCHRQF